MATETEDYSRRPETLGAGRGGRDRPPRGSAWWQQPLPGGKFLLIKVALALLVIYGAYYWLVRRVVVEPDEVLVLMKKDGGRSLPGDQVVIPDASSFPGGKDAWEKQYGDAN